jgi:hypothetical protein
MAVEARRGQMHHGWDDGVAAEEQTAHGRGGQKAGRESSRGAFPYLVWRADGRWRVGASLGEG